MKKLIFCMFLLLFLCGSAHGFTGSGTGTAADPYLVNSAALLNEVRDELNAHYRQTGNIDLSGYPDWEPIDNPLDIQDNFIGSYDGQNYTISNLTIDRPLTDNVGLFGHVGQGAVIQNVRLETVDVIGGRAVGSLIGRVTGNDATLIMRCYADGGTVVGYDGAVGGLVGSHNSVRETPGGENNPVISQCYANIDVSLAASPDGDAGLDKFGGLVGCTQKGTILDSYARGSVTVNNTGAERIGGLAGCNVDRGRILRSYSTGLVDTTSATLVGGLLGNIDTGGNNGIVEDSFWDEDTSNQTTSAGGTGKTTAEMKNIATYTDTTTVGLDNPWDFNTIWSIDATINDGYPYLLWQDNDPPEGISWDGSTDDNWDDATNWTPETVPTLLDDVTIPTGTANEPVIGPQVIAQVHDLTVQSGAILTIQSDATDTGTLIVEGESTGDVTVNRHLGVDRWYIIGPPVVGQGINALLTDAGNNIAYTNPNYGATDYNEPLNKWNDYFTDLTTGNFSTGTGYLMRRQTDAGAVSFTGQLETGTVTEPVTTNGFRWNAVGNPYSAAMGITGNASTPQNFLFFNRDNLDAAHRAIYIWDDETENNYVIVNNAGFSNYPTLDTDYVQLGQGFIVRAAGLGNEVVFTPDMRVGQPALMLRAPVAGAQQQAPITNTTTTTTTQKQWPGVTIAATVNQGADTASAGITFHEDMTLEMDSGYDAGVFKGNSEVAVYTRLAAGDDGEDYGLQCLPPSAMEWLTLPVGLETKRDGEVTFSFEKFDLPKDAAVVLEDRKENTETEVSSSQTQYTTTVDASEPAYGRFYLSFASGPDAPDDNDGTGSGSSSGCFIGAAGTGR